MINNDLSQLQKILGVIFDNTDLLQEALTHSSYVNENPSAIANERLEFVGDAVLGLILAEKLFQDYPNVTEGDLTQMRAHLVCQSSLAIIARSIGLGDYLYLGRGEATNNGRDKSANLAGALEAVCAAVYLDRDWQSTRACIIHLFKDELARSRCEQYSDDYKSHLQEVMQHRLKTAPSYRIVAESGPAHDRQFTAEVTLNQKVLACGSGRSKKLAEAEAARIALEALSKAEAS